MIAIIADGVDVASGPIPIALAHAGFDPHEIRTTDEAARCLETHGPKDCVLVVQVGSLFARAAEWLALLREHGAVAAVIVARGEAAADARAAARAPHRILLEDPFDAAAIAAAAIRVSASARGRLHRVSPDVSRGSRYAS